MNKKRKTVAVLFSALLAFLLITLVVFRETQVDLLINSEAARAFYLFLIALAFVVNCITFVLWTRLE